MSDESDSPDGPRPDDDAPSDSSKPGGGRQRRRRRRGRRGAARKRRPEGASEGVSGESPTSVDVGATQNAAIPDTSAPRKSRRKSRRNRKRRGAAKMRSAESAHDAASQRLPGNATGTAPSTTPDVIVPANTKEQAAPAGRNNTPRRRSTDVAASAHENGTAHDEAKRQAQAARRARAERETSAGGIVYRVQDGEALFLLIRDSYRNWGFPKGHLEAGEGPDEAALREVTEETGLAELQLDGAIETIDWFFRFRGRLVHKVCHFYLMRTEHSRTVPQREEGITACRWARYEEATRLISYANARAVLMRANDMVNATAVTDHEGDPR